MSDPLTQVVGLLQPSASFSKLVVASGAWTVRRVDDGRPFYCAVLEGGCRLTVAGQEPIILQQGDFVLIHFATSSLMPPPEGEEAERVEVSPGVFRLGRADAPLTCAC